MNSKEIGIGLMFISSVVAFILGLIMGHEITMMEMGKQLDNCNTVIMGGVKQ